MSYVPADFHKFVFYIESSQQIYIKLSFASLKELKMCVTYLFDRAVLHPDLAKKFAEAASKLYFLTPPPVEGELETVNLRKALILECATRLEDMHKYLESASNLTLEKAIGTIKFFGELFNIGFIFKGIVKRHMDLLELRKNSCYISNRCYYALIETVKERVETMSEQDYSVTVKSLMEAFQKAEENPTPIPEPKAPNGNPQPASKTLKVNEQSFPKLNAAPIYTPPEETFEEKMASFKRLLDDLTSMFSSAELIKKIERDHKNLFDDGTWQLYYDAMIEKALSKQEVAATIVDLCQKIPRCKTDAWHGIKRDDYLKHICNYIINLIEKFFDGGEEQAHRQISGILNLIQKLLDQSMLSLTNIAAFYECILRNSSEKRELSAKVLLQLTLVIKTKYTGDKIRKLPEETRKQAVQLITTELLEDVKYGKHVATVQEYLIDNQNTQRLSQSPGMSQPHQQYTNGASKSPEIVPNNGFHTTIRQSNGTLSSSESPISPSFYENGYEAFDFSNFIDNLSINNIDLIRKSVRESSVQPGWDLKKLAQTMFEKALKDGSTVTYIRFGLIINEETRFSSPSFEENLRTVAMKALGRELSNSNAESEPTAESDLTAESTAKFLSELFKVDWLSNGVFFLCMEKIASDKFESIRRIKMFLSLVKPAAVKLTKDKNDIFIFYLQMIRLKASTMPPSNNQWMCMELVELLEAITAMKRDTSVMQAPPLISPVKPLSLPSPLPLPLPMPLHMPLPAPISPPIILERNIKLDTIIAVITNVNLNDIEDCVKKIKLTNIRREEELQCLADTIIQQSVLDQDLTPEYAKLIQQLIGFSYNVAGAPPDHLKALLINGFQLKFRGSFEIVPAQVSRVYSLVQLISELYKVDVVDQDFIQKCMDSFFCFETRCENTVRCISLMLTSIGAKLEKSHESVLNRYFNYFDRIVLIETSFRAKVYQELITLRKNKWNTIVLAPETPPPAPSPVLPVVVEPEIPMKTLVIDFSALEYSVELDSVAFDLKQHLTSASRIKGFITAILSRTFTNFHEISACVKLFKMLADAAVSTKSGEKITFNECLVEAFNFEFVRTSRTSFSQQEESAKAAFANLIVMVGELYKNDIYSDEDLHIWLLHKNVKQIPVKHLTYLSATIAPKIQRQGSEHLIMVLKLLEISIHNIVMEVCLSVKRDIADLAETVQYLQHFNENNPDLNAMIAKF